MKISTKTGDNGVTSLLYDGRVGKDSLRVEAYGTLDELCSFLGLAKSNLRNKKEKGLIEKIQADLFIIGSEIVTKTSFLRKLKRKINEKDISYLESMIEKIEEKHPLKEHCFLLPGENRLSAALDTARTVARRAERRTVTLTRKGMIKNHLILIYLNRLSDLLYLLTRIHERRQRKVRYR
jgi:ATP:cob(I)alamin adenosyltransferase